MTRRGTTNRNARGSSTDRRARREWLVATFRADVDVLVLDRHEDGRLRLAIVPLGHGEPACRCYRCGELLTVDTVSPDRIKPGCEGGTYRRDNIRPACLPCQSRTGQALGAQRRKTKPRSKNSRKAVAA